MKKNTRTRILPIALLTLCLANALTLCACSSNQSPTSEEQAPEDPKYTIQLFIDCEQNFIFSKYDVDVIVDGEDAGNIEHGSEATFELSLTKGQHELLLEKEGFSEPDGKTTFVVEGKGDKFAYEIRCTSEQIEIESIKEAADEPNSEEGEEGLFEQESIDEKTTEEPAEKESDEPKELEGKKETKPSKYEYAYIREMTGYDLYYLIDLDDMAVTSFGTNDSGSMVMPCSGNLENGLTVDYVDDGFQEHLQFKNSGDDSVLVLTDANGFDWEYTKTDVAEAEEVLASVS